VTFKTLFLSPLPAGIALAAVAAVVIVAAAIICPAARRPLARWLAVALGCAAFVAISLTAYVSANDLYLPSPDSLFNRLNVAAAPAYCLGFVALLAAFGVALRALASRAGFRQATAGAVVVTAIVGLLVAGHQFKYSRNSQRSYALAWKAEGLAMRGIRRAVAKIPERSPFIVSFGHPIWEQHFIPVFAANWDLRGAIADETRDNPVGATPFFPGMGCGAAGLTSGTETLALYRSAAPLWFVDAATGAARHIASQPACQRAVASLTPLPFFDPAGLGSA
jgi:hypothetical protein